MIEKLLRLASFIPKDKLLHFAAGVLIAAAMSWAPLWFNVTMVFLAAAGKEAYDYLHPAHTSDPFDCLATMLGGVPVWLVLR